ncbi:hypothetical protein [Streptomyces tsukubensis]|uniref:Uncharacterized protein n=1 Tax=Streptomyces tsukubensis TaxID=83656 RepID=A0A1V4A9J2_9ACTN|nr:hypothetical protein [Streptomyces tsukubensis]OON79176.1 hypothetical protein B1H18_14470 [Streptomyces tsukubensis]QFR94713.1 hypothetical protein GBW32_18740 [Streptomyces tsukubensis]
MAHNPQAPQGPEGTPDPAGSTQMFRAFVDEEAPRRQQQAPPPAKSKTGLIVGVIVAVVIVIGVVWLAVS